MHPPQITTQVVQFLTPFEIAHVIRASPESRIV
jgi:hypothetical protein